MSHTHTPFAAAMAVALGCVACSRSVPPVESIARWGSVASSVYPSVRAAPAARRVLDAGPATQAARHPMQLFRSVLPGPSQTDEVWDVDAASVMPLLQQLHPGATPRLRHASGPRAHPRHQSGGGAPPARWNGPAVEGAKATWVRKTSEERVLLVRVHAEFELAPGEIFLLPSQFEGHFVWSADADTLESFHLGVPPRNTNYDLNVGGKIDIGFLPLMEVASPGARPGGREADEARRRLRRAFYPSERIEWRTLEDGLARAKESGRPLHVLQLFGTLDDESC